MVGTVIPQNNQRREGKGQLNLLLQFERINVDRIDTVTLHHLTLMYNSFIQPQSIPGLRKIMGKALQLVKLFKEKETKEYSGL